MKYYTRKEIHKKGNLKLTYIGSLERDSDPNMICGKKDTYLRVGDEDQYVSLEELCNKLSLI